MQARDTEGTGKIIYRSPMHAASWRGNAGKIIKGKG